MQISFIRVRDPGRGRTGCLRNADRIHPGEGPRKGSFIRVTDPGRGRAGEPRVWVTQVASAMQIPFIRVRDPGRGRAGCLRNADLIHPGEGPRKGSSRRAQGEALGLYDAVMMSPERAKQIYPAQRQATEYASASIGDDLLIGNRHQIMVGSHEEGALRQSRRRHADIIHRV